MQEDEEEAAVDKAGEVNGYCACPPANCKTEGKFGWCLLLQPWLMRRQRRCRGREVRPVLRKTREKERERSR